ncbi:permease [Parvibium lacunae]|uniref:Permease n=2 Tax=Parvibium lacunae TaxID=1888893 RepID=A0A368L8I3_9BURK|nr:permease [Parvibium lacunae]
MKTLSPPITTSRSQRLYQGFKAYRLDRVWLTIGLILLALAALDQPQLPATLAFVSKAALNTFGFLLLSVGLTAYAKASGVDNLISRAFSGPPLLAVVSAALMGAVSPFCSCGVIPIIVALLAMGVPLAPVMAFWLASPLMDPSMFIMTSATLGLEFAVAKTMIAVSIGLLGGWGAFMLTRQGWITDVLKDGVGNGGCAGSKIRTPKPVVWAFWKDSSRLSTALASFKTNALFLVKWLLLAFVLESLMVAYLPRDLIAQVAGGTGFMPVLLATLVGIPSYLNGYAALPLVSGLMGQGLSPGASMAFLVAGGVTSLPAAMAVWAVARARVFAAYLGFAFLGALASGVLFGLWKA